MTLNPMAAFLWLASWGVIATTTIWCFYRMLGDKGRK